MNIANLHSERALTSLILTQLPFPYGIALVGVTYYLYSFISALGRTRTRDLPGDNRAL